MPTGLVHRHLFRALLLVSLAFAGAERAKAEEDSMQRAGAVGAALEALRGRSRQARAMLVSGKGDSTDPAALVVLASLALDEGNIPEAVRLVARLRGLASAASDGRLLDALLQERAARPDGDWVTAGINAVAAAQPVVQATDSEWFGAWMLDEYVQARTRFPEKAAQTLSVADRFLARWAWPSPAGPDELLLREALRMAASDERQLVLIAAMDVLSTAETTAPAGMREDVAAALRSVRRRLRALPARFASIQPSADVTTVAEDEVAAIEAISREDPPSFTSNYTDLLRILDRLDPARAPLFAQAKAVQLTMPPTSLLTIGDRIGRSKLSAAARERLAAAFMRLADRERREGLLVTDLFAVVYMGNAHMAGGDPALRARTEAASHEARRLSNSMRCLFPLARLPIRSLWRAWAEQKPHEREIAQQVARRGLSCPDPALRSKTGEEGAESVAGSTCPDPTGAGTR